MAPKTRKSAADMLQSVQAAGTGIQERDRQLEARSLQAKVSIVPLHKIVDRVTDTRELNERHVEELAISISVLGLLEPLVLDIKNRLLAGGHRKAAIYQLKERKPSVYSKHFPDDLIPSRVLDFDADRDPDLALQVEIAENEKRRDYTPAEVKKLAEQLKLAGYVDTKGRPALGEKALRPALEVIIGKSQRTVRRYLNESDDPKKSGPTDLLSVETTALASLQASLSKWTKVYGSGESEIVEQIDREVVKLLNKLTPALKKARKRESDRNLIMETTPHSMTYAQISEEEDRRQKTGEPTAIDVEATTIIDWDIYKNG